MKKVFFFSLLLCFTVVVVALNLPGKKATDESYTLKVKWIKSYPLEHWRDVREGLRWTFSYLGAALPAGSFDKIVSPNDSSEFTIDFSRLGFSSQALQAFSPIIVHVKTSEYYRKNKYFDLSRLVAMLLGNPDNYYSITGAAPTLSDFQKRHSFKNALSYGVTHSAVARHHRIIRFNPDTSDLSDFAFLALEGDGDLHKGTFKPLVYEAFDVMANGQIRFAVYDEAGKRISGSPSHLGNAGKPAKCLWCHEINILPLFVPNEQVNGLLSNAEFELWRSAFQRQIDQYRMRLDDDIDFSLTKDHTYMEMLYISFMEPSLDRIMNEWGNTRENVITKMGGAPDHVYEEFPQMGRLYYRYYVDSVAGIYDLSTPFSVRELVNGK